MNIIKELEKLKQECCTRKTKKGEACDHCTECLVGINYIEEIKPMLLNKYQRRLAEDAMILAGLQRLPTYEKLKALTLEEGK